jgi:hypothetical protein
VLMVLYDVLELTRLFEGRTAKLAAKATREGAKPPEEQQFD